jgi:hypothetical protein
MNMIRKVVVGVVLALALPATAHAAISGTGTNGATITIATNSYSKNTLVKVDGKSFDETVGIYLAYCVVPKKGELPSPCGGGVNKSGTGESSYWISSNPPPYGIGLAIPFQPGGRFSEVVSVTRKIGKYDCRKVKCAITVRSDHLHEGDRTHDIFIPIKIK